MFTIKLYKGDRQRILSAESFTIMRRENGDAEITLHQRNQLEDARYDITSADSAGNAGAVSDPFLPPAYHRAIIENAAGKTTEIVECDIAKPKLRAAS